MNFFRKKESIFASFSAAELKDPGETLGKNLLSLLPVKEGMELRLNVSEVNDIPLTTVAILISFSERLQKEGAHLSLTASPEVVNSMQKLHFGQQFDSLLQEVRSES